MKRNLVIAAAVVVILALIWRPPAAAPLSSSSPAPAFSPRHKHPGAPAQPDAVVYVAGAVKRPGLYHLRSGARADDGVRAAGGLLATADASGVNLAERVSDGQEILVPVLGEPTPHSRARRTPRAKTSKANGTPTVIDLNSASPEMLASVPGIGKTIASRIVAVRERDGPFQTTDELLDVAGMTQKRLERAEPYLRI